MNNPINTNVIIGSRLALAMAMAKGSPVRSQFINPSEKMRAAVAKMAKQGKAAVKQRRGLFNEPKAQEAALQPMPPR